MNGNRVAYVSAAVAGLGLIISGIVWMESRYSEMRTLILQSEVQLGEQLEHHIQELIETKGAIIAAIDRNEEWVSKEHQAQAASNAQMLVVIANSVGRLEGRGEGARY